MKTGIELISEERERQVAKEGWTASHDDHHQDSSLIRAAVCYADYTIRMRVREDSPAWPWDDGWNPSRDPIRNLVKAGALIAAEIDRRQRDGDSTTLAEIRASGGREGK